MHSDVHKVTLGNEQRSFFSLMHLTSEHISVLQLLLTNQPIPVQLQSYVNTLKEGVEFFVKENTANELPNGKQIVSAEEKHDRG